MTPDPIAYRARGLAAEAAYTGATTMSNKTEPLHAYRMRETEDDDWKVVIAEDLVRAVEIWHHHHAQDDPFSVEHLDCEVLTKYSDLDDDENSAFTGE